MKLDMYWRTPIIEVIRDALHSKGFNFYQTETEPFLKHPVRNFFRQITLFMQNFLRNFTKNNIDTFIDLMQPFARSLIKEDQLDTIVSNVFTVSSYINEKHNWMQHLKNFYEIND